MRSAYDQGELFSLKLIIRNYSKVHIKSCEWSKILILLFKIFFTIIGNYFYLEINNYISNKYIKKTRIKSRKCSNFAVKILKMLTC